MTKPVNEELSSDQLWLKIINEGVEDRVEVNQRMLIDKMLARYSSNFVVYRELIQNSDDAQATSFTLQIICQPPSTAIFTGQSSSETDFHNWNISEIRTVNNGHIFSEDDWKRVITIAEGNTNIDAIGQFGVGFFSVFSCSERPMIRSGKYCLAFAWQNGKSLTTFRKQLPVDQQSSSTSILLPMKEKYILQIESHLDNDEIIKSKKIDTTNEIIPILDLIQLKSYFTKMLSFTKYLNEIIIYINDLIVFHVTKRKQRISTKTFSLSELLNHSNNQRRLLHFKTLTQSEQTFDIINGPSITLNHIDVEAEVVLDKDYHQQIQNVLKKSLPSIIHIEFLYPTNTIFEEKIFTDNDINNQIFKRLLPIKFHEKDILPSGQIFIGLATHQSTGIGVHVFTHLIPTIERENIDLQDPYISIWNEQLLISIGQILRLIYDQTMLDVVHHDHFTLNTILSFYAFQTTAPNQDVGRLLLDGFFSFEKNILVPVRRYPSNAHLSLISSTEAFLSNSKHIQTFLSIPLIPSEFGHYEFFKILKRYQKIREIDCEIIVEKIHESILSFNEFVALLRWLCSDDMHNQIYTKNILSEIYYRDTDQSDIIELKTIAFYDHLNISLLPFPPNVLPSNIVCHLSREDLQKRLYLSEISIKNLIEYYLLPDQQYLFVDEKTSRIVLSIISQHWSQLNQSEWKKVRNILIKIKCIPTSVGMKLPTESYIPSSNLSPNLPVIALYLPQISIENTQNYTEYFVSIEFLKSIGCRTIHLPTMSFSTSSQSIYSSDNEQTLEIFIKYLLEQREHLSDTDLHELKNSSCLIGTRLDCNGEIKRRYRPNELHFPSVAKRLQSNRLLIIDWIDINPFSQEYSFLKELGVREVPDLNELILQIVQEHNQQLKTKTDYKLPNSLIFFAENFRQYYFNICEHAPLKTAFLPSFPPETSLSTEEIILSAPESVFREPSLLCPSLLPDVLQCFSNYFDISLLGIKCRPQLATAFDVLMPKRDQLLTVKSASIIFSYLNKLDGLDKSFVDKVANESFIPLSDSSVIDNCIYLKPSEIFIRSKSSSSIDRFADQNPHVNDDIATAGLIDYVDYGLEANSFLFRIGVLSYPTAKKLADLLIERQASYFAPKKENTDEIIKAKLRIYTNCLKQLATVSNIEQQFNSEPLKSRLINESWCLAYQIIEHSDGTTEQIFRIAKPSEIYLDDDHQSALDLQPLCVPDEPELIKLYERFGAKWLSDAVQRTLVHQGEFFQTKRSLTLRDLIQYRLDMLFVNNRGEYLENINRKHIELLRTELSVYETESIQCQLTFQCRTIVLNSTNCSSCALEYEQNQVCLYIHKDISTLDYIDIATELTRFVHKKAQDVLVHSISDKLASPLETLKRRGIPVDRLLKTIPKSQIKRTIMEKNGAKSHYNSATELIDQKIEQCLEKNQLPNGFLESLKDFIGPMQNSSSFPMNSLENLTSRIERDRIYHFGRHESSNEDDIERMIETSRPYVNNELNRSEYSQQETNNSCEFVPAANMIRYHTLLHGIPLYLDRNVTLTNLMLDQGKQLAWLLIGLAKQVFHMPELTIHLFRDIDSARIAFNNNGALFFNLRYFEQVFADNLRPHLPNASSSISIVRTILNFYFIITCHELAHNIDTNHDLRFLHRLERVLVKFMDAKEIFLNNFTFE